MTTPTPQDRNTICEAAHQRAFSVADSLPSERLQKLQSQLQLIAEWEHLARCKFQSAELKSDEFERRFIEHGAWCYFNCAQQLKEVLASASPPALATPLKAQT